MVSVPTRTLCFLGCLLACCSAAEAQAKKATPAVNSAALRALDKEAERLQQEFVDSLVTLAYREAKNSFTLPGVGKLVLVNRKARMGRNPATGEAIKIPAKKVVKFRVAKAAKDAILGPSASKKKR